MTMISPKEVAARVDRRRALMLRRLRTNMVRRGLARYHADYVDVGKALEAVSEFHRYVWTLHITKKRKARHAIEKANVERHRKTCLIGIANMALKDGESPVSCDICDRERSMHMDVYQAEYRGTSPAGLVIVSATTVCLCGLKDTHCLGCIVEITRIAHPAAATHKTTVRRDRGRDKTPRQADTSSSRRSRSPRSSHRERHPQRQLQFGRDDTDVSSVAEITCTLKIPLRTSELQIGVPLGQATPGARMSSLAEGEVVYNTNTKERENNLGLRMFK